MSSPAPSRVRHPSVPRPGKTPPRAPHKAPPKAPVKRQERRSPSHRSRQAPGPATSPRRARRHPLAFYVFSAVLVGLMVLGLAALNAMVAQMSFRSDDLTARVNRLEEHHGSLVLEAARLSSPERIAQEARRLGLRTASRIQAIQAPPVGGEG